MPNAKVLSEKQAIVAALAERLNSASAGVFVDYKGITVDEDTKLRTELRQNDVEYSVVKNTLTRFALKDVGLEAMSDSAQWYDFARNQHGRSDRPDPHDPRHEREDGEGREVHRQGRVPRGQGPQ